MQRPGTGHGQVVGGADHRQLADVATGKFERLHHIAIGAEGQAPVGQRQNGRVESQVPGIGIQPAELLGNECLHGAAATAMGQLDARD